jgi:hypothetical protein
MAKGRWLLTTVVLAASPVAGAATGCKEFLAMPSAQQHLFVRGLVDGMGTAFGVMDTFKKHLKNASKSPEESAGIDKMHGFPQEFLSKGCCLSNEVVTEKIIKGCKAKPEIPAGNMLTDVMSGEL